MSEKGSSRMRSHVMVVPENFVRNGTGFNTNVLLLDLLNQVWVHQQASAVADSLSTEENSVIQLGVCALV